MRRAMSPFRIRAPENRSFTPPEFYTRASSPSSKDDNTSNALAISTFIPPHHANSSATLFKNPWDKDVGRAASRPEMFRALFGEVFCTGDRFKPDPVKSPRCNDPIPVRENMTWEPDTALADPLRTIFATWLGHACYHLRIPIPNANEKTLSHINVLTDPVFDDRCSPFSFMGPKRITPVPTSVEKMRKEGDKARVDFIIISHNHYDHLSYDTIKKFISPPDSSNAEFTWKPPKIFVPLGQKAWYTSSFPKSKKTSETPTFDPETDVHELDWWEERIVELEDGSGKFSFVCTPAMHQTGRALNMSDRNATLWCSWFMRAIDTEIPSNKDVASVYFTGDTGYRSLLGDNGKIISDYDTENLDTPTPTTTVSGEPEPANSTCPAFKEIYDCLGAPHLALIPIGAYEPRKILSYVHASPLDAVQIHLDLHSRHSLAMHWATWKLSPEHIWDPARLLDVAKAKFKLPENDFVICDIGQTVPVTL